MDRLHDFSSPNYTESNLTNSVHTIKTAKTKNNNYCEQIFRDGRKYYSCTFPGCSKFFQFKSEFVRHRYIHTPERPAQCSFLGCTKGFKREDALKNHMRIHTGETPYKCQEPGCEQSFPSKAGLRYHSLKHKGEKEYICRFGGCNKRFLNLSQLRQHEKTLLYHKKLFQQGLLNESQENLVDNIRKEKHQDKCKKEDLDLEESKWRTLTEEYNTQHEEKFNEGLDREVKRMVEFILNKNNTIKMRLDMCTKLKELLNTNKSLENKFDDANFEFEKEGQSPGQEHLDQNILAFLKFNY